jgi:hypothetical protein
MLCYHCTASAVQLLCTFSALALAAIASCHSGFKHAPGCYFCYFPQMPKEKKNEFPIDLMGGEAMDSKGKKGKGDGFAFAKGSSKTARVRP